MVIELEWMDGSQTNNIYLYGRHIWFVYWLNRAYTQFVGWNEINKIEKYISIIQYKARKY